MSHKIELTNTIITSKEDEVAFLKKLQDAIGPHIYLASLFTDDLIYWVKVMLSNDLAPDIKCALDVANTGRMVAVGNTVERASQVELSEREVRVLKAEIDELTCDIREQALDLKQATRQRDSLKQTVSEMQDDIEYLRAENLVYEHGMAILKARLYDIQNPHPGVKKS